MSLIRFLPLALLVACGDDPASSAPHPDIVLDTSIPDVPDIQLDSEDDVEVVTRPPSVHRIDIAVDTADWEKIHDKPQESIPIDVTLTIDGLEVPGTSLEMHGGVARTFPKKSYRVTMPDEAVVNVDLFGDGIEAQRRFVLKSSWIDRSFLREPLAMKLVRDSGGLAPRIAYTELHVNGTLLGLYLLVERIDKPYLGRQGFEKEPIHLYKAENHAANWADKANPRDGYDVQIGVASNPEDEDTSDLGALLDACSHAPLTDEDYATSVEPQLEVEDFVIWQRCHTFMGNRDTFTKNYYLYHDLTAAPGTPEARFRIVSWDADSVFGLEWDGKDLPGDQSDYRGTDQFSPRLFQVPKWRARHLDEYDRALGAELAPEAMKAWVDEHAAEIAFIAPADLAAWQPGADWQAEVERLKTMIDKRWTVMRAAIDAAR